MQLLQTNSLLLIVGVPQKYLECSWEEYQFRFSLRSTNEYINVVLDEFNRLTHNKIILFLTWWWVDIREHNTT
jgi:hypothetical protein